MGKKESLTTDLLPGHTEPVGITEYINELFHSLKELDPVKSKRLVNEIQAFIPLNHLKAALESLRDQINKYDFEGALDTLDYINQQII